jgi:glyoxylate reductase
MLEAGRRSAVPFKRRPAILDAVKILATRRFPGPAWDELREVELLGEHGLDRPRPGVEVLVLANERVDEPLLALLPDLRLVANYGVGYDRVDLAACMRRGVAVTNTPGVLDAATADLALALMLACRRRVVEGDRFVREGRWGSGWAEAYLVGDELGGATLGIVGLGRIGGAVARRALGFDLRVLYTRRNRLDDRRERELGVEYRGLDALLAEADVISLHVPRTAETEGLIDARRLALIRDGACLVNTARGEIVDEPALVRELVAGRIRAGLDVFAHEPDVPAELLGLPNVVLTPHLGSATAGTREAMTRLVVDNVLAAEAGRPLLTPVAPP